MNHNFQEKVNFIWSIADLLRGDYKQAEFQDVILPLTVLKRLDDVLEPTKEKVLKKNQELKERGVENKDLILTRASGYPFFNISKFTFQSLLQDANNMAKNLRAYINGFSQNMYNILENFEFENEIKKLDEANLLYLIIQRVNEIDLHPEVVSNHEMGTIFEELIRKFSEQSNETAGEHFTPRKVIRLMVRLLIAGNGSLKQKNIIRTIYDPAGGTGGMLTTAKDEILELNPSAKVYLFGQELNPKTFAIAKSDILIKGEDADNIKKGNSFSEDQLAGRTFDLMLSNPPFGVEWKKVESYVRKEAEELGFEGRFGAGLPRISDGSLLFLQHMISKMKPVKEGGSRIAIVFNGSPLFTGDAGSGESEIRKWIIENDWLEVIVGLPDQLFYNTGIYTYIWIVTNNKSKERKGKVQLIDAREYYEKMRKSLGNKRNDISDEQIEEIVDIYKSFRESDKSKIFSNNDFGYHKITVERPLQLNFQASDERIELLKEEQAFQKLSVAAGFSLRKKKNIETDSKPVSTTIIKALKSIGDAVYKNKDKFEAVLASVFKKHNLDADKSLKKAILKALSEHDETADMIYDKNGNPEPTPDLRDYENVPLKENIYEYFEREVKPHLPDAWIDEKKTKVGYEISFTKYFYKYRPLRPLDEITGDIKTLEEETRRLIELLKEKRQAIISHAVTKGIPPHPPLEKGGWGALKMKDSGIEWIGEIPERWEVKRLKYVAEIVLGKMLQNEDTGNDKLKFYMRAQNIQWEVVDTNDVKEMWFSDYEMKKYRLQKGDLLVSEGGEVGRTALWNGELEECYIQNSVHKVTVDKKLANNRYLLYLLEKYGKWGYFESIVNRVSIGHLTREKLKEIEIICPPKNEQEQIVTYLDKKSSAIDKTIQKILSQIEKLKEYRQALISNVVTGKVKINEDQ